jgi:hypothetical protein
MRWHIVNAKLLTRLAGTGALLCIGLLVTSATAVFATAVQIPIDQTSPLFIPVGAPPTGVPGVSVAADCPAVIQTAAAAIEFVDGNGHVYGPTTHPLTNGANVEGNAYWLGFDDNGALVYSYFGQGHAWFGQNNVPNPSGGPAPGSNAEVQAQTISFHGTGALGSLDVQASFGQTQSASGHLSGWGHLKVTC